MYSIDWVIVMVKPKQTVFLLKKVCIYEIKMSLWCLCTVRNWKLAPLVMYIVCRWKKHLDEKPRLFYTGLTADDVEMVNNLLSNKAMCREITTISFIVYYPYEQLKLVNASLLSSYLYKKLYYFPVAGLFLVGCMTYSLCMHMM